MTETFAAVRVSDHVHWVGAVDWNIRNFHGYETGRGTTYNAYLVTADKTILIDTVKRPFFDEMTARIASVVGDPSKIDFIISNHSEMDHSGSLVEAVRAIKPEKVYASAMGVKALGAHFHGLGKVEAVGNGQKLNLGGADLTFLETRMLHWPDSMITYLANDRLLFSQDGFGMHLASSRRFDDEIDGAILEYEARKYYANILLPFSPIVLRALDAVAASGLDIATIAPDHGPIWRSRGDWILGLWRKWAEQKPSKKAVIAYDTMWGSTDKMARAIADGVATGGCEAKPLQLTAAHRSDVATEVLDAGALLVGSPTMNNNMFPTVADVLCYLRGLKPKNLIGAAFGSYGWSGEAVAQLAEALEAMGVGPVGENQRVQYVPDEAALAACRGLGLAVAERLRSATA